MKVKVAPRKHQRQQAKCNDDHVNEEKLYVTPRQLYHLPNSIILPIMVSMKCWLKEYDDNSINKYPNPISQENLNCNLSSFFMLNSLSNPFQHTNS